MTDESSQDIFGKGPPKSGPSGYDLKWHVDMHQRGVELSHVTGLSSSPPSSPVTRSQRLCMTPWLSGRACDSSKRYIHKVVRSIRAGVSRSFFSSIFHILSPRSFHRNSNLPLVGIAVSDSARRGDTGSRMSPHQRGHPAPHMERCGVESPVGFFILRIRENPLDPYPSRVSTSGAESNKLPRPRSWDHSPFQVRTIPKLIAYASTVTQERRSRKVNNLPTFILFFENPQIRPRLADRIPPPQRLPTHSTYKKTQADSRFR